MCARHTSNRLPALIGTSSSSKVECPDTREARTGHKSKRALPFGESSRRQQRKESRWPQPLVQHVRVRVYARARPPAPAHVHACACARSRLRTPARERACARARVLACARVRACARARVR
eukprot:6204533-Pleurochrysis_carterae.AAC.1